MDGKFIHSDGDGIAHCPYCRGVLFKAFKSSSESKGPISFIVRCPHCQETVRVEIKDGQLTVGQTPNETIDITL